MSKPIVVNIPHDLGRAEARRRIEQSVGRLSEQMGAGAKVLSQQWDGDKLNFALSAMGQSISGVMDVGEREVRLELLLPGILGMIAGKLKGKLQKEGQLLLERPKP